MSVGRINSISPQNARFQGTTEFSHPTRLKRGNQPELNRHVAAAIAKRENRAWRLAKSHRTAEIDALIAMGMAIERAEPKQEPVRLLGWV